MLDVSWVPKDGFQNKNNRHVSIVRFTEFVDIAEAVKDGVKGFDDLTPEMIADIEDVFTIFDTKEASFTIMCYLNIPSALSAQNMFQKILLEWLCLKCLKHGRDL